MKIKSLQISNILSFQHYSDISQAQEIAFEDGVNLIIGENGAGKSTALEVLNFIFKRVLYKQFTWNSGLYLRKSMLSSSDRKQIISASDARTYTDFRLDPNWNTEDKPQTIRLVINLDEIDLQNLSELNINKAKLKTISAMYSNLELMDGSNHTDSYTITVTLDRRNNNFSVSSSSQDFGFSYLCDYNYYKLLIYIYNLEHPRNQLTQLFESFTLISGYRNYSNFSPSISLRESDASQQIQQLLSNDYSKSLNSTDLSEPSIFGLVRLKVAEKHFNLITGKLDEEECERKANRLPFITAINKKLKIVNLKCKIKLTDLRTWQYSFELIDLRRNKPITNINSLSAGQKSIVHLIFEAYGRGTLRGGLVIIDEPEVHLHYQFQNEYLQVINDLNKEQNCQYVIVTHSEALITSATISYVKRFALNKKGFTQVFTPKLSTKQKTLIKVLDNTRATYAFFAKKILLVEGSTDHYFYRAVINECYPKLSQEIAVLDMGGKDSYPEWHELFISFGLNVFFISDFEFIVNIAYPQHRGTPLKTDSQVNSFKQNNPDWNSVISSSYKKGVFVLKNGNLEHYLNVNHKGMQATINFCNVNLKSFLSDNNNAESLEIRSFFSRITK